MIEFRGWNHSFRTGQGSNAGSPVNATQRLFFSHCFDGPGCAPFAGNTDEGVPNPACKQHKTHCNCLQQRMSSTQFDTISECVRDAKVIMKAKTQRSGLLCKYVRKALNELWRTDPENGPATGAAVNADICGACCDSIDKSHRTNMSWQENETFANLRKQRLRWHLQQLRKKASSSNAMTFNCNIDCEQVLGGKLCFGGLKQ